MLHIFPLREILPGPSCSCTEGAACGAIGKHPLVEWTDWDDDEENEKGPGGGYGIPTGVRNGILVVEGDIHSATPTSTAVDGVQNILDMGPLPETLVVESPSGSVHFYFQYPVGHVIRNSAGDLGPGIDVRGEGGMVVGPDSPHKKGGTYQIAVDVDPAPLPEWLLKRLLGIEALRALEKPADAPPAPALVDKEGPELERAVSWATEYLAKAPPCVQDGTSSKKLMKTAAAIRAKRIPVDKCLELLTVWDQKNTPPWGVAELRRALGSAEGGKAVENSARVAKAASSLISKLLGDVEPKEPEPEPDGRLLEDNCARPMGETTKVSLANLIADLRYHKDWHGVLSYDDLRKWVMCKGAPVRLDAETGNITDVDFTRIRVWLERHGKVATKDAVIDAVNTVAMENKFNPVLNYLDSLPKVDGSALNDIAKKALGNDSPLAQDAMTKTLIAAVRRMRKPGTKVDTVLVLRGSQGLRKSSFLTTLFGEEYVKSQMPDLASKDASVGLRGMWAVELAEMDRVIRAESSTVKEFITRAIDSYRPPYGRTEEQFPRQCIFIGTTNDARFLVDETGNRRYWIIEVSNYDLCWVKKHRDEIWSAVSALEARGVPHWYEDDNEALDLQRPYEFIDEWEEPIRDYLTGRERVGNAAEIYTEVIARGDSNALAKLDRRIQNRVMNILTCRLGCIVKRSHGKYWIEIPKNISSEKPSPEENARREASAKMREVRKLSIN